MQTATPTLRLHGRVGMDGGRAGFTAASVSEDLAKLHGRGPVTVSLNSTGGSAVEGRAISAALNAHPDGVEVIVEGTALSAAALIACLAARSAIAPGSTLMLHRSAINGATADKGKPENKVRLDALDRASAEALARKSGKPVAEIEAMLKAETWLTADEAVAAGFINRVVGQRTEAPATDAAQRPALSHPHSRITTMPAQTDAELQRKARAFDARMAVDSRDRSRASLLKVIGQMQGPAARAAAEARIAPKTEADKLAALPKNLAEAKGDSRTLSRADMQRQAAAMRGEAAPGSAGASLGRKSMLAEMKRQGIEASR